MKKKIVKPHKISTHSAHLNNCYFYFFYWVSDWVEIFWGFTKFCFKQMLKISPFYLVKQKSFNSKKWFRPQSILKFSSMVLILPSLAEFSCFSNKILTKKSWRILRSSQKDRRIWNKVFIHSSYFKSLVWMLKMREEEDCVFSRLYNKTQFLHFIPWISWIDIMNAYHGCISDFF